jgi:DNA (cytosine-5)-methyltransferase 1
MEKELTVASLFSGAWGLDLGFEGAGFKLVYANDNWKGCWETFDSTSESGTANIL